MSPLNTTNVGRIKWGLLVMSCVVCVSMVYKSVLNENMQKRSGHSWRILKCYPNFNWVSKSEVEVPKTGGVEAYVS